MRSPMLRASAIAITIGLLAGCGQVPGGTLPNATGGTSFQAMSQANAQATDFARAVTPHFAGTVHQAGSVVTLQDAQGLVLSYDFSRTAATGNVAITAGAYTTSMSYQQLMQSAPAGQLTFAPGFLMPIAIAVVMGGAKALAAYSITHVFNFNKQDAVKATVAGMLTGLIDYFPGGKLVEPFLLPVAMDVVNACVDFNYAHVASVAMGEVDRVLAIIKGHIGLGQVAALRVAG